MTSAERGGKGTNAFSEVPEDGDAGAETFESDDEELLVQRLVRSLSMENDADEGGSRLGELHDLQ